MSEDNFQSINVSLSDLLSIKTYSTFSKVYVWMDGVEWLVMEWSG